ncbi:MAG: ATP-binding protein [Anaerolineales bacterium]|jgi:two-component system phosphate regulon sensor histidine kinase PhoR
MFHSIRWRIAVPYLLLILIVMGGSGVYISNFTRRVQLQQLESELTAEARLVSDFISPIAADAQNADQLDALAKRWSGYLDARVTIIARDGTVLGESDEDRTQMENHLNRPEIQQALSTGRGMSIRFSQTLGIQMLYSAVTITNNGNTVGFARLALPLEQVDSNVGEIQRTIILSSLVAAALAILLAIIIAQYTTRPLRELTQAAQKISMKGPPGPLLSATQDEVGQLTRAFNTMGVQIREQFSDLEKEQGKLAAVLQQMTDGVLIVDDQGVVQLINPAAERMFSVRQSKTLGNSLASALRHHQIVDLWQHSCKTGEGHVESIEFSTRHMFLQGVAIPLEKTLPGNTLLLFQDLTHLRHLETVRRDFISNISHELRTPLAALKALTETLQEGALDDPPAAQRFLSRIDSEVDSLTMMVQELLELSRIESGKVPLQLKSVSARDLLENAAERLRLQAERAGLDMSIELREDLPTVWADPPRLEQVIVNLLHNAIKFTPVGGHILLSADQKEDMIVFSVSDTGVGISADALPRIFERFYKTDRARSSGGTGLGLSIARHLVEAHGGRIWAESVEGKGSVFYFTVPVAN